MRVFHFLAATKHKRAAFVLGIGLALAGLFAGTGLSAGKVHAADCSNDIICGGFSTPADFISKVQNGNSGNNHSDLQSIYAHAFYGGESLPSSQYSDFAAHAYAGTAYKNGTIVVVNQTVATGTSSVGRLASYQGSGYSTYTVGSNKYYGNVNSKAFASDGLPVYVLFDSQGKMTFAVMKDCGNPIFGAPTNTTESCKVLNDSAVSGKANTYNFTAAANATGNAKITKYVYDFGDGSATITEASGTTVVPHTYTKSGSFTAKVTVYATFPGSGAAGQPLAVITNCTKVIKVTPAPTPTPTPTPTPSIPYYNCVQLNGSFLDQSKMEVQFVATASTGNGATLASGDFDFGDGTQQTGVAPTRTNTIVVTHTYASAGDYNAGATLHFTASGQVVTAPTCKAVITPTTAPTPECKPGVPVGSAACTPCQYNANLSSDSAECVQSETSLPNTGAGDTIAIFAVVMVGGFLVYRQLLYRRHKAAFAAAEHGTAALPLGQPLNSAAPLAGTPLEAKRHSSFRRRQF